MSLPGWLEELEPRSPEDWADAGLGRGLVPGLVPHRTLTRSAGAWTAGADPVAGFALLASGRGRGEALANAIEGTVEAAIAMSAAVPGGRGDDGLPAAVSAVVGFLRAAHQDLRQGPEGQDGDRLEVVVAMAHGDRLFIVQAGDGARCLRRRDSRWEMLAPLGERRRPALGSSVRALIEVTREPLHLGDLVVAVEQPADGGERGWVELDALEQVARWAEGAKPPAAGPALAALRADVVAAGGPTSEGVASRGEGFEAASTPVPATVARKWPARLARGAVVLLAAVLAAFAVLAALRALGPARRRPEPVAAISSGAGEEPPPVVAASVAGAPDLAAGTPDRAAFGALAASTEPAAPDVWVLVDGRAVGLAPVAADSLPAGRHRVSFEGPGGYRWEEEVMVRAGEVAEATAPLAGEEEELALVTVEASLLTDEGRHEVEGAEVVVDGVPHGRTPVEVHLDPGVHGITLRRPGKTAIHRVLEVRRGDALVLDLRLDRALELAIEHAPPAAAEAGGTMLLTAVCRGGGAGAVARLDLHLCADGRTWTKLPMGVVPGAPGARVIGVPVAEASRRKPLRYYFSCADPSGETVFSPIFAVTPR